MSRHKSLFRLIGLAAFGLSVTVHVLAMGLAADRAELPEIEGGAEEQVAALGSSFQDLVRAGDELSPVDADVTNPVETTENTQDDEVPTQTEPLEQNDVNEPLPLETQADAPVEPSREPLEPQVTPPVDVAAPQPVEPQVAPPVDVAEPAPTEPVETQPSDVQIAPVAPLENSDIAAAAPVDTTDVVEAEPSLPVPTARPFRQIDKERAEQAERDRRNAEAAAQRRAEERRQAEAKAAAGRKQSNAQTNERAGTSSGQENARSAQTASKPSTRNTQAGNAAASNYPGKVYSKIARTRQRNAGGRGVARVRFNVSSSGGVSGLSVAGSSGNAKVDSAAISHVQRAAPFPAPPAGAQTTFVIPIEFRR